MKRVVSNEASNMPIRSQYVTIGHQHSTSKAKNNFPFVPKHHLTLTMNKSSSIYVFLIVLKFACVKADDQRFLQLVEKVESDVIELAREAEKLYKNRCTNFVGCYKDNYHECITSYPDQTCPGGEQLGDKICGDDITCSRLWDYSVSRVSLPEEVADGLHQNPTNPEVIETACFSRHLDQWFRKKHQEEKGYWKEFGLETPPVYFGAHNGLFRIYPAYRSQTCGDYDPRNRSWYIAASSGPKNIILVLDVSGSMNQYSKLDLMKEATKRIVSTLGVGDRIAIVPFATEPTQIFADNGHNMYVVTEDNKELLIRQIEGLYAEGKTNFYEAFVEVFDIFETTFQNEFHVDCNSAILFFTDGAMSTRVDERSEQDVIDFISNGISDIEQKTGHSVFLLTYSISGQEADRVPYQLSCSVTSGVWSKLEDESQIIESLTSYYQLFALGLGDNKNENFTAWVEPYLYADGVSTGTTVSAPVYDREKDPHLFLGVVGLDFRLVAVDIALGKDKGDSIALDRVIRQSTAKCPSLSSLSHCELESYRRRGVAGIDALCSDNCTESEFVSVEPEKCNAISDYPDDLWANFDEEGMSYEQAACCLVGETSASEVCGNPYWTLEPDYPSWDPPYQTQSESSSRSASGSIVAVVIIVVVFVVLPIGWAAVKQRDRNETLVHQQGQPNIPMATVVQSMPASAFQGQNAAESQATLFQPAMDQEIKVSAPPPAF